MRYISYFEKINLNYKQKNYSIIISEAKDNFI